MNYQNLPVYQQKDLILEGLDKHQVIVVESPTGSGKTTQIPVILHEAGYTESGMVGVTQPRRIAALSVSEFISKQLETDSNITNSIVGYKMRFEDKTTPHTLLKIMTDGILLQELKTDPLLSRYSVIMVDEAHERSLNIDFILGLLKQILKSRPEFKVIISSATINCKIFSDYFNQCPIIKISTPIFPIELKYAPIPSNRDESELYHQICSIVSHYLRKKKEDTTESHPKGDILIFLQGEKNIKDCTNELLHSPFASELKIMQLYGRLSKEEQEKVFTPTPEGKTKVVISTNIAETSVTIDKISLVIDSGLAKMNYYSPYTFTSSLIEQNISKASANQRKGRAGRTGPGICYRLYSSDNFERREEFTTEEIYRTDLSEVILRMSDLGITDFENFDYISAPKKEAIIGGIQTLELLDAINKDRHLTEVGKRMVYFPLMPRHARILVEAILTYPDVLDEVIIATSFLSTNSPFLLPQGEEIEARLAHNTFRDRFGDFVSYLKIYRSFLQAKDSESFCKIYYLEHKTMTEIVSIKNQLEEMISGMGIPLTGGGGIRNYLLAIARGLIQFVCVNDHQYTYRSMTAEKISIHPGSVLFKECPQFVVAGEIVKTSKMFARSVSPLNKEWLNLIYPNLEKKLTALIRTKNDRNNPKYEKIRDPRALKNNRPSYNETHQSSTKAHDKKRSNTLLISGHEIELIPFKGKKIASLQWAVAKQIANTISINEFFKYNKIRATIVYQGKKLFFDHKLPNLIIGAKFVDPDRDFIANVNLSKNYDIIENPNELFDKLDLILKITKLNKNELAPIALVQGNSGIFYFRTNPSIMYCLDMSLNSLEEILETVYTQATKEQKDKLNRVYSRLTQMSQFRHSRG